MRQVVVCADLASIFLAAACGSTTPPAPSTVTVTQPTVVTAQAFQVVVKPLMYPLVSPRTRIKT
jgi:hypothetical protein